MEKARIALKSRGKMHSRQIKEILQSAAAAGIHTFAAVSNVFVCAAAEAADDDDQRVHQAAKFL